LQERHQDRLVFFTAEEPFECKVDTRIDRHSTAPAAIPNQDVKIFRNRSSCSSSPTRVGVDSTSFLITLSVVTPSDAAVKFARIRWRRTGKASDWMSSCETFSRPYRRARALAPRIRFCTARGPAPHDSHSLTNLGTPGSLM